MPLEYIKRIRLRHNWIHEERKFRSELKRNLAWLKEQLDKPVFQIQPYSTEDIYKEQTELRAELVREITSIQDDIRFSTYRVELYEVLWKVNSLG